MFPLPNIDPNQDRALCAITSAFLRPMVGMDCPQAMASCIPAVQGKIHSRKTRYNALQGIFSTQTISAHHWTRENAAQVNSGDSSVILPVLESAIRYRLTGRTSGVAYLLIMRSHYLKPLKIISLKIISLKIISLKIFSVGKNFPPKSFGNLRVRVGAGAGAHT